MINNRTRFPPARKSFAQGLHALRQCCACRLTDSPLGDQADNRDGVRAGERQKKRTARMNPELDCMSNLQPSALGAAPGGPPGMHPDR